MKIENYMKEKDHITIPISWMPTHFYTISFQGWDHFTFDVADETSQELVTMAAASLDSFIRIYKNDRVFSEPMFCIQQDGRACFQIGTIKMDEYERRCVLPPSVTTLKGNI